MEIPAWVAPYVGLEFADNGRGPKAFDCWGLVIHVLGREFGVEGLPDFTDRYSCGISDPRIPAVIEEGMLGWIRTPMERAGHVLLFNAHGQPWHVGLIVAPPYMLHIKRGANSVVERYDLSPWKQRLEGIYRRVSTDA